MIAHEAGDESGGGAIEHLARCVGLFDAALVHDHDEIGERHRLFLAVGDMDEGDPELMLQLLQLLPHLDLEKGIERRKRLVEQQRLRIGDKGASKRDALLLAAGQLRRTPLGQMLHLHELQHVHGFGAPRILVDAFHLQAEGDVVDRVEMGEQRVALEHHRRAAPGRRQDR